MTPKFFSDYVGPVIAISLFVYAYVNVKEWLPIVIEFFRNGVMLIGGILV